MYGLSMEKDLSFLEGLRLEQICIGLYQLVLQLENNTKLSLECYFEHYINGKIQDSDKDLPSSGKTLIGILGLQIKRVNNLGNGGIELIFSAGNTLKIFDSNKDFESYQITSPENNYIV